MKHDLKKGPKQHKGAIYFKRLDENAQPLKKNEGSAGYDIFASEECVIPPKSRLTVSSGLAIAFQRGYVVELKSRSGLAAKHWVDVCAGVIDSNYRGEVKVVLHNHSEKEFQVIRGVAIAQLLLKKVCDQADIVEINDFKELEQHEIEAETERGDKGFGSTDSIKVVEPEETVSKQDAEILQTFHELSRNPPKNVEEHEEVTN